MTLSTSTLFFALAAASPLVAQQPVPPDKQPVSGSCVVSLGSNVFRREKCELSVENGVVPNGFLLVIQHVSAGCSTTPSRGIFTLALITRAGPDGPVRTTHIPVSLQATAPEMVRLIGAQIVRIYAGSATGVEALLSTIHSSMPGETGCDISFSGVLRRINQ